MDSLSITPIEIETIKQAQAGSEKAFNKIFYKYKTYVERILLDYVKDYDEAKDLANIVFLKIHDKINTFSDYTNFKGWIITVTKNVAIDYIRSKNSKLVSIDDTERNIQIVSNQIDPQFLIDEKDIFTEITSLFDELPELNSKICKLYYIYNLPIKTISKKLNVPNGTIKSYLHRSRNKIKSKLKLC